MHRPHPQSDPCRGTPCGCPILYGGGCPNSSGGGSCGGRFCGRFWHGGCRVVGEMGTHKGCPYRDDSVDVVGHCDKCVHGDGWETVGHFVPNLLDHLSGGVQPHLPVHHDTKQRQPPLHYNGHEIGIRLRVIVSLQAKRASVLAVWIIGTIQKLAPVCDAVDILNIHDHRVGLPPRMFIFHKMYSATASSAPSGSRASSCPLPSDCRSSKPPPALSVSSAKIKRSPAGTSANS